MQWDRARFAAFARRLGLGHRGHEASASNGWLGPAQNTAPPSKPCGASILTPDRLRARAVMQNNRSAEAVARYLAVHLTLCRGR
jgi:hypothetical protein